MKPNFTLFLNPDGRFIWVWETKSRAWKSLARDFFSFEERDGSFILQSHDSDDRIAVEAIHRDPLQRQAAMDRFISYLSQERYYKKIQQLS